MPNDTVTCSILKVRGQSVEAMDDEVVQEVSLTILYNQEEITTLLCSPSQIEELIYGFLLNEGMIHSYEDIYKIRYNPENNSVWVEGKPLVSVCSGENKTFLKPLGSTLSIPLQEAYIYAEFLQTHLPLFQATGGVHSGGIGSEGKVLLTGYDIGRHNLLDKLRGNALRSRLSLENHVLFFSGRVSSQILLKTAKMNIPILIARGAPTALALSQAAALNITVIGFAREQRLNIYTCAQRIRF